jgi:hypothetical protein
LPFCHSAIPLFCHSAILPFCHSAIRPFCHSAILPFCHSAVPPYPSVIPPFRHSTISSPLLNHQYYEHNNLTKQHLVDIMNLHADPRALRQAQNAEKQ